MKLQNPFSQSKKTRLVIGVVISIVLVVAIVVSLLLVRTQQDTRQQASVATGIVEVRTRSSELRVNQPAKIQLTVETQSMKIDGVQLFFTVMTDSEELDFQIRNESGLQLLAKKIDPISGGYDVKIITTAPLGEGFISSSQVTFGDLILTPKSTNPVKITFAQDSSMATQFKSSPVKDQLKTLANVSIPVTSEGDGGKPTALPTSTGSAIVKCDQSCATDSDCVSKVNSFLPLPDYICYRSSGSPSQSGNCRLRSNPTSNTCFPVSATTRPTSSPTATPITNRFTPTPTPTPRGTSTPLPTSSTPTPTPIAESTSTPTPSPFEDNEDDNEEEDDDITYYEDYEDDSSDYDSQSDDSNLELPAAGNGQSNTTFIITATIGAIVILGVLAVLFFI